MAYVNIVSQLITDGNGKIIPIRGLLNADGSVSLDTTATLSGNVTIPSGTYINVGTPSVNIISGSFVDVAELPNATTLIDGLANPLTTTIGAALKGYNGVAWDRLRVPTVVYNANNVAIGPSVGGGALATPPGANKFRLMGGQFSVNQACSVQLFDNSTGTAPVLQTPVLGQNTQFAFDVGNGLLSISGGYPLRGVASVTGTTLIGYFYGCLE